MYVVFLVIMKVPRCVACVICYSPSHLFILFIYLYIYLFIYLFIHLSFLSHSPVVIPLCPAAKNSSLIPTNRAEICSIPTFLHSPVNTHNTQEFIAISSRILRVREVSALWCVYIKSASFKSCHCKAELK